MNNLTDQAGKYNFTKKKWLKNITVKENESHKENI